METTKIIPFCLSISKWKPPPPKEEKIELFKSTQVPKQIYENSLNKIEADNKTRKEII